MNTTVASYNLNEEEENKLIQAENDKKIQHKNFSFRASEFTNVSDMLECCKVANNGLTIWDHSVDNTESTIIDIGLGVRANMIILHGFNNRNEKISKLNRYAELVQELYS